MPEHKKISEYSPIDDHIINGVKEAIKQFNMITRGDSILIAISGGPDSVFLAHILCMLREELNLKLYGYSLDHSTRKGQSGRDMAFVIGFCKESDIRLFSEKIDAVKWCRDNKLSFQEGAGKLRKQRLYEISEEYNIDRIALGHNLDDNIETFLMRLIRGSGARGLSGIGPVNGKIIRPLINIYRKDIESCLKKMGISYCTDKTNLENKYFRNRIRNKLIPFIRDDFFKNFKASIRRSIEIFRDEDSFLRKYSLNRLEQIADFYRNTDIIYIRIPIRALVLEPPAIQRRIIVCALGKILGDLKDISFKNIEDIIKLANKKTGESKWLRPKKKVAAFKTEGSIHIINIDSASQLPDGIMSHVQERINSDIKDNEGTDAGPEEILVKIGGQTLLSGFSMTVNSQIIDTIGDYKEGPASKIYLDYEKIASTIRVRRWEKGDRFCPLGIDGSKKLQDYFIDSKVAVNKRKNIPIFHDREKIIWVGNMGIDDRVKISSKTSKILCLELFEK